MARRAGALPRAARSSRSRRPAGSTSFASRAARAARRRRAAARRALAARVGAARSGIVVVWGAAGAAARRSTRAGRGIERTTAALLLGLGVGLWRLPRRRRLDRRRAPDLAARRARPRGAAAGGLPRRRSLVAVVGARARDRAAASAAARRSSSRRSSRPARCSTSCTRCCPGDDAGLLHSLTPDAVGPLAHAAGVLVGGRAARRGARPRTSATPRLAGRDGARARSRRAARAARPEPRHARLGRRARSARSRAGTTSTGRATRRPARLLVDAARASPCRRSPSTRSAALWLNRMAADQPFTLHARRSRDARRPACARSRAARRTSPARSATGSRSRCCCSASRRPRGSSPAGSRRGGTGSSRRSASAQLARALVHAWGVDTLAPFVLRADKSYFFADDESAFLAYRVVGGVAIVSGDPIGPPRARPTSSSGASSRTRTARDWRIAILGASERVAAALRGARAARALPRRRGDRRHRDVLARGPRDPQGAPVRAPARATPATRRACCARASSTARLRDELEARRASTGAATSPSADS